MIRKDYPTRPYTTDLRSLAAMRMLMALVVIADLMMRAADLRAHYSDAGVLPRAALLEKFSNVAYVSVYFMNGTALFQAFLFLVTGAFALCMLFGYRTRLMTALTWFMMISLHARNPMVLQAGDVLLRLLLFWGMFLPLGARWSVDALFHAPDRAASNRYTSVATIGLLLQVALVYWYTVMQKLGGREWWPEGTAVYYALHVDTLVTPLGVWLRQHGAWLKPLTFVTLGAEALLPFLLFLPWFTAIGRLVGIAALVGMHASFSLCMELGNFPWVDLVSFLPFIPGEAWDFLETRLSYPRWAGLRRALTEWQGNIERLVLPLRGWHTPKPPSLTPSRANQVLAIAAIAYVIWWNQTTVPAMHTYIPAAIRWTGEVVRLDQSWGMFAPYPVKDDGWYVIEGKLRDHRSVDVKAEEIVPPNYDQPALLSATYPNQHWRKYMMNLWAATNSGYRLYYARYLCREWNDQHSPVQALEEFWIYYMRHDTLPDYQPRPTKKVELWHHYCFK